MVFMLSRRCLLAGLAAAATSKAMAQEPGPPGRSRNGGAAEIITDPRATTFDVGPESAPWRIFVGLPDVPAPAEGYSAIISVDGNATFPLFWQHRQDKAPDAPVVLVGVGYPVDVRYDTDRRWYDLTSPAMAPTAPQPEPVRGPRDRPTGGRAAFLDMIESGVLPELQKRLPLNIKDMTLYGHSLGGLFVLHALFTRPKLFARFAAADPSTWWNAGEALKEASVFAGGIEAAGGRVAPAIKVLIASSGKSRRETATPRLRNTPEIVTLLSGMDGLDVTYRLHPDESHGSLTRPSTAEALDLHLGKIP